MEGLPPTSVRVATWAKEHETVSIAFVFGSGLIKALQRARG